MWIVAFDIIADNVREFNRKKRAFYYHLGKLSGLKFISKSVMVVEDREAVEGLFERVGGIRAVWIKALDVEEVEY